MCSYSMVNPKDLY